MFPQRRANVNEAGPAPTDGQSVSSPVFVSYATADRKRALDVCKAIERRPGRGAGSRPAMSLPGENYPGSDCPVRFARHARDGPGPFHSKRRTTPTRSKKELSLAEAAITCRSSRFASRTSSRATLSPTSSRPANGSMRLKDWTRRLIRWCVASANLAARLHQTCRLLRLAGDNACRRTLRAAP